MGYHNICQYHDRVVLYLPVVCILHATVCTVVSKKQKYTIRNVPTLSRISNLHIVMPFQYKQDIEVESNVRRNLIGPLKLGMTYTNFPLFARTNTTPPISQAVKSKTLKKEKEKKIGWFL